MTARWGELSVHVRVGVIAALGMLVGQVVVLLVFGAALSAAAGVVFPEPMAFPTPTPSPSFGESSGGYIVDTIPIDPSPFAAGVAAGDPAGAYGLAVVVILLSVIAAGYGGWFVSRRTGAPVEKALAAAEVRLQTGFADGSRFAANASHELRTPLAASRTMLQVALKTPRDDETDRLLGRLLIVNDRMIGITEALLDLASAENELATTEVELRTLVADAITLLEPEIAAHRIRLRLRLDDVRVNGHEALLRQLVTNLVRNAVVHNVERGSLTIVLSGDSVPNLAIENDGRLIEPELVPKLMQPFTRHEERTHRTQGSGLGLAIAGRIVDAHHAGLTLTARPSGGLIVHLVFPDTTV